MGGANSFTVNVTKQETFDRTKELLDEFLPWFSVPRFHIGTDEYPTGGTQKSWALTAQGVEPGGTVERGGFQFAWPDEDGPMRCWPTGRRSGSTPRRRRWAS